MASNLTVYNSPFGTQLYLSLIDMLKLSVLRKHRGVAVEKLGTDEFLIRFQKRSWIYWTRTNSWVEVSVDTPRDRLGEVHFGPVSAFYRKNILEEDGLPKNHGKRWEQEDTLALNELIETEATIAEIADRLDRSVWSVVAKAGQLLGIDLSHLSTDTKLGELTFSRLLERELPE